MSSARYDLHSHSTASDGMLSPRELVALAAERGLAGIALTDHDTLDGFDEAEATGQLLGVRCISGVELSCTSAETGEVHLLGYFVDPQHPQLRELFAEMHRQRMERAERIVARVFALTGKLTMDDVLRESAGRAPGRPHIARAMVRHGIIAEPAHAFSAEWIGSGGRAFVARRAVELADAIATIHAAGGAAVFAHPGSRSAGRVREEHVRYAAAHGLDGIEVDHPDHGEDALRRCAALARELDLAQTGGSDDHGFGLEGPRLGCRTVPERAVSDLERRAQSYRG